MNAPRYCPDCGSPLPPNAPEGICPECLMKRGLSFSQDTTLSVEPIETSEERDLPNPGDQFGEYRIIRELGRGGMGAVYEAEQIKTSRRVALKVLAYRLKPVEVEPPLEIVIKAELIPTRRERIILKVLSGRIQGAGGRLGQHPIPMLHRLKSTHVRGGFAFLAPGST